MAELEDKLATGTPLDELMSILDDIRERVNEAERADVEAQAADTQYCDDRDAKLMEDVRLEQQQVETINATINKDKATIKKLTAEMKRLDGEINRLDGEIEANKADQKKRTDERTKQKTEFRDGVSDANICITAIDEIQALGGMVGLRDRQNDDESDYQAGVTNLLQTLSTKVQHTEVLNLVQLSALTVATLDKGDVDKLDELLQKLEDELKKYIKDITADDKALDRQHKKTMADLAKTLSDLEADLRQTREAYSDATVKKISAESRVQANTIEMGEAVESLAAVQTEVDDLRDGCSTRLAAHKTRSEERTEEKETINSIEKILREKLGKHFTEGSHMTNNVTTADDFKTTLPDEVVVHG